MRVKKVEYLKEYKLKVTFSDEAIKIVDLENIVKSNHGIFLPLKDLEYFKKVAIDDCQLSICWPNGADVCPDVLYKMGVNFSKKKHSPRKPIPKRRKDRSSKLVHNK